MNSNFLQMGVDLKYEYPKGKWRPTLAAGGVIIWLSDLSFKKVTDIYTLDRVRPSTVEKDFNLKSMYGFEVTPGVHYYYAANRIIFIQAQYMQCYKGYNIPKNIPNSIVRSFGLSAGIYF
jgi:hypothetical protein